MTIDVGAINYLAVIAVVIGNMVLGALWYSPLLFANPWMKALGLTREQITARGSPTRGYVIAIISSIVSALALSVVVQLTGAATVVEGAVVGGIVGLGFVATAQAASYGFESRPLTLFLINTGYPVATLTLWGIVLTLWR